jgi:DNA replication ATP-dependent helicase Dna2
MSHAKPSAQDEANFMDLLLSGIDATIFDIQPSPDRPSAKRKSTSRDIESKQIRDATSTNNKRIQGAAVDEDITALLEGAENWVWDDVISPVKKKPKVCINLHYILYRI